MQQTILRSKRTGQRDDQSAKFTVTNSGQKLFSAGYGFGTTLESFMSDADKVKCDFGSGVIMTFEGHEVRTFIRDYEFMD